MDFREAYFENKLKNVSEEMTLVSKQLMLIQDFIIFEFGSKFQKFCESRRGGRYFRDVISSPSVTYGSRLTATQHPTLGTNTSIPKRGRELPVPTLPTNVNRTARNSKVSAKVVTVGQSMPSGTSGSLDYTESNSRSSMPSRKFGGSGEGDWSHLDDSLPTSVSVTYGVSGATSNVTTVPSTSTSQTESGQINDSSLHLQSSLRIQLEPSENSRGRTAEDNEGFIDESESNNDIRTNPLNASHRRDEFSQETVQEEEIMFIKDEPEPDGNISVDDEDGNDGQNIHTVNMSQQPYFPDIDRSNSMPGSSVSTYEDHGHENLTDSYSSPDTHKSCKRGRPVGKMIEKFGVVPWNRHFRKLSTGEVLCTMASCNRKFKDMNKFRRHFLKHTGIRPFKCDMCAAAYTRNDQLTRHKQKHAQDQGVLFCNMCSQNFHTSDEYGNHICLSGNNTQYHS